MHNGASRSWVSGGLLFLNFYGAGWLLGDYRLMAESAHSIQVDALHIDLGARWHAKVPYSNIAGVVHEHKSGSRFVLTDGNKRAASGVAVTPYDATNVTMYLRESCDVKGIFGRTKTVRRIDLFVEKPVEFVQDIKKRCKQSRGGREDAMAPCFNDEAMTTDRFLAG